MAAVKVTASKGGKKAPKGKALSVRFEKAKNGFTSHTEFEPTPRKKGSMSGLGMDWKPEPPTIHPDVNSMKAHLDQHFGDGGQPANDNDADDQS